MKLAYQQLSSPSNTASLPSSSSSAVSNHVGPSVPTNSTRLSLSSPAPSTGGNKLVIKNIRSTPRVNIVTKIVILCKQHQILCGTTQICSSMAHSVGVNTADCINALPTVRKALTPNGIIPTLNTPAGIKDIVNSPHCDRAGYPLCYDQGHGAYNGGPCPSGHSRNFCVGWNDAANASII